MTELQHDTKNESLGLTEDELGIIRLLRHKRTEGAAERMARIIAPPAEPEDDDLPPGRLGGNEFSAEEELAYYIVGKLMVEGVWTRRQLETSPTHEVIIDLIAAALREAIPTFSPDRKSGLAALVRYADPEITRREVDEAYAEGRLP